MPSADWFSLRRAHRPTQVPRLGALLSLCLLLCASALGAQTLALRFMGHTTLYRLVRVIKYPTSQIRHHTKMVRGVRTQDPGWQTTAETKHIALDKGAALIRETRPILHDQETIEDLLAVQRGKTGTVEMTGRDAAQSWLLAYQGRKHPVASSLAKLIEDEGDRMSEAARVSQRRF